MYMYMYIVKYDNGEMVTAPVTQAEPDEYFSLPTIRSDICVKSQGATYTAEIVEATEVHVHVSTYIM